MTFEQALKLVLDCASNTARTKEAHHAYDHADRLWEAVALIQNRAQDRSATAAERDWTRP